MWDWERRARSRERRACETLDARTCCSHAARLRLAVPVACPVSGVSMGAFRSSRAPVVTVSDPWTVAAACAPRCRPAVAPVGRGAWGLTERDTDYRKG